MFATVEEAEKAVAMLRRFGGRDALAAPAGDGAVFGAIVTFGCREPFEDWEQVADYLLAWREGQADRRAGPHRAKVREYLNTAHDICNATTSDKSVAIRALIYAVEELLR